jgi:hypothetical protein
MNIFKSFFYKQVDDRIIGRWQCGPQSLFDIVKLSNDNYLITWDTATYTPLTIKSDGKLYFHDDKKPLLMWMTPNINKLAVYYIWPWKHISYLDRMHS